MVFVSLCIDEDEVSPAFSLCVPAAAQDKLLNFSGRSYATHPFVSLLPSQVQFVSPLPTGPIGNVAAINAPANFVGSVVKRRPSA